MTARQCFEGLLTELSKVNAPSMLLADFNYFFNKAVNQYINKRYNIYDINQQTTDDLRVLKATTTIQPKLATSDITIGNNVNIGNVGAGLSKLYGATYEVNLPLDYLHLLNCVCIYRLNKDHKCYDQGDYVQFSAKRLTGDSWSQIINDFYNRPLPERPYYYIHNVNISNDLPTNPSKGWESGTDSSSISTLKPGMVVRSEKVFNEASWINTQREYVLKNNTSTGQSSNTFPCVLRSDGADHVYVNVDPETGLITNVSKEEPGSKGYTKFGDTVNIPNDLPRTITIGTQKVSLVEKPGMNRYGNASPVRMEIRYGHDNRIFELVGVSIDYIKAPQHIRLTQEQVNLTEDTSQIMEFPDYVCQEIINELVHLVMETNGDPRLQSHAVVTESIGNPAQQQAQPSPRG